MEFYDVNVSLSCRWGCVVVATSIGVLENEVGGCKLEVVHCQLQSLGSNQLASLVGLTPLTNRASGVVLTRYSGVSGQRQMDGSLQLSTSLRRRPLEPVTSQRPQRFESLPKFPQRPIFNSPRHLDLGLDLESSNLDSRVPGVSAALGYTMDTDWPLDRRDSRASSISLQQLDPSPIASPSPAYEDSLSPFDQEGIDGSVGTIKSSGSTGTVGLSGSGISSGSATGPGAIFYRLSPQVHPATTRTDR